MQQPQRCDDHKTQQNEAVERKSTAQLQPPKVQEHSGTTGAEHGSKMEDLFCLG
jgi:hypothetical protein